MNTDSSAIIEKIDLEYKEQIVKLTAEHKHYADSIQLQLQKLSNDVTILSKSLENQLHVIDRAHEFYNIAWIVISALVVIFAGVLPWYLQKRSENKNDKMQNKLEADILTKNKETKSALESNITNINSKTKTELETTISNKISETKAELETSISDKIFETKKTLENDISSKEEASVERNVKISDKIKTDFDNLEEVFNAKYKELEEENRKLNLSSKLLIDESIQKLRKEYAELIKNQEINIKKIQAEAKGFSYFNQGKSLAFNKGYRGAIISLFKALNQWVMIQEKRKISIVLNNINLHLPELPKENIHKTLLDNEEIEVIIQSSISDLEKILDTTLVYDSEIKRELDKVKNYIGV